MWLPGGTESTERGCCDDAFHCIKARLQPTEMRAECRLSSEQRQERTFANFAVPDLDNVDHRTQHAETANQVAALRSGVTLSHSSDPALSTAAAGTSVTLKALPPYGNGPVRSQAYVLARLAATYRPRRDDAMKWLASVGKPNSDLSATYGYRQNAVFGRHGSARPLHCYS